MNEFLFSAAQFIALAVVQGTPILFGSVGEIITEDPVMACTGEVVLRK